MARSARVMELRGNLRRMSADAVAFSVMVGTGETYLAAFVLALGLGEVTAGLIASLPMLAGGIIQLVSPVAVRRLGSHRTWVVLCAAAQAASFLPLVIAAFTGTMPRGTVFIIAALYWGTGMATGPAWNTWAGTLIPARLRAGYFARRSRWAHLAVLAGLIFGGLSLQWGDHAGRPLLAFAVLFMVAGACRAFSAALLAGQTEPQPPDQEHRMVPARELLRRFRHHPDGRLLVAMLAMQFVVQISGPYFTPYMLGNLKMSYASYLLLIATSYTARVMLLPAFGAIVRRVGSQRVMWLSGLGILPLSALWIVDDSIWYLFCVQFVAGAIWAAYELATFLLLFETIREEERTSVLTTYNLAYAAVTVGGSLIGAAVLGQMGGEASTYMLIFALSALGRVCVLPLLGRAARMLPPLPVPEAPVPVPTRVDAVRPNLGSIERPVLPAFAPDAAAAEKSTNQQVNKSAVQ